MQESKAGRLQSSALQMIDGCYPYMILLAEEDNDEQTVRVRQIGNGGLMKKAAWDLCIMIYYDCSQ
jgi:hypothetical protein